MTGLRSTAVACVLLASVSIALSPARAEEPTLAAAQALYASAAYDEALRMLEHLLQGSVPAADHQTMGLYRALCLVALGRGADADRALEALVVEHPRYRPPMDDLSPRLRGLFVDTRARVLPSVIQRHYAEGKAAFDREDFAAASSAFARVLEAFDDPDLVSAAGQPPLADLRVLATGFHDLSLKELELPPLPAAAPILVAPAVAPRPARDYTRVYTAEDPGVVLPAVIRQAFPPFPGRVTTPSVGLIEVLIRADGTVESAMLRASVHPAYDNVAVAAARRWRYEPARVDGVAVQFLKRVQITLTPTP